MRQRDSCIGWLWSGPLADCRTAPCLPGHSVRAEITAALRAIREKGGMGAGRMSRRAGRGAGSQQGGKGWGGHRHKLKRYAGHMHACDAQERRQIGHSVNNCWGQEAGCAWGEGHAGTAAGGECCCCSLPDCSRRCARQWPARGGWFGVLLWGGAAARRQAHAHLPARRRRPSCVGKRRPRCVAACGGSLLWPGATSWRRCRSLRGRHHGRLLRHGRGLLRRRHHLRHHDLRHPPVQLLPRTQVQQHVCEREAGGAAVRGAAAVRPVAGAVSSSRPSCSGKHAHMCPLPPRCGTVVRAALTLADEGDLAHVLAEAHLRPRIIPAAGAAMELLAAAGHQAQGDAHATRHPWPATAARRSLEDVDRPPKRVSLLEVAVHDEGAPPLQARGRRRRACRRRPASPLGRGGRPRQQLAAQPGPARRAPRGAPAPAF